MDKVFKYYAFISYKHEDEKWAKWLQKRLETYRLPVALQKQQHCPKKLKPVFRDNTDMTPGNLAEKLHENLELSNYLIVICSKNLAKESRYVDYEMQTFINMGRGDKIIPFIVDGEPYAADPRNECFNAMIKNFPGELLAANAKKDGKRTAALKVIASILRLNADDLIKRDKKRKSLRNALISVASVVSAMFLCITLGITFNLTAQNYEKEAINSNNYSDYSSAIKYAVKSLKVPFNKDKTGEAAQILRSRVIADELNKSNNQFHKEFEIKAKTKALYLLAESADGTKVGFTDFSRVFVYDSATGKFLREFHKSNEKDELEEYMGIEIDESSYLTNNSYYELNKEPKKHTEVTDNSSGYEIVNIYDTENQLETYFYVADEFTEWIYSENEDFLAISYSKSDTFIYVYSFENKINLSLEYPEDVSSVNKMYFSPEGRYLFVDFYVQTLDNNYSNHKLCVYDLECRKIVFECKEDDEVYNFWVFSKADNYQSFYVFSPYKVEKYTYIDKTPDVNNIIYSGSDGFELYIKNNNLSNIFFSDDGNRAVSVNSVLNKTEFSFKTIYTFFEPDTGKHLMYAYFGRDDDVIDITPDIKYAIMCLGNKICIYEIENCEVLYEVSCDNESIRSVAISKDGKYAAYLDNNAGLTILTADENGKYKSQAVTIPDPEKSYDKEIIFINNQECITNFDGLVQMYNIETGDTRTITDVARNTNGWVYGSRFDIFSSCKDLSEQGMILETIDIAQFFAFYDIDGGEVDVYDTELIPCDYSPKTEILVGSEYTNQELNNNEIVAIQFDKNNRKELYRYSSNIDISEVIMDNNGKYVVINGPEGCEVLDALSGDLLFTLDRNILIYDDIVYDISDDLVLPDALPHAEIYSINKFIRQGKKIIN